MGIRSFDGGRNRFASLSRSGIVIVCALSALSAGSCQKATQTSQMMPMMHMTPTTHPSTTQVDILVEVPFYKKNSYLFSVYRFSHAGPTDAAQSPGSTYGMQKIPAGDAKGAVCLNCGHPDDQVQEDITKAKEILALSKRLFQFENWKNQAGWTGYCVKISVTIDSAVADGILQGQYSPVAPPYSTLPASANCNGSASKDGSASKISTIVLFLPDAGADRKEQLKRYPLADKILAAAE